MLDATSGIVELVEVMRLLVTAGSGMLGHALQPQARAAGHELRAPGSTELDLFDRAARFGLLDGPGTGHDDPVPALGATLHVADAARALLSTLTLPSGIYNVCRDGERVSSGRFTAAAGWHPEQ